MRKPQPVLPPRLRMFTGMVMTRLAEAAQNSVWLGSWRPRDLTDPTWRGGHDETLHDLVVAHGRPLLLVARNSDARTRKGSAAAATDAHDAAIDLARVTGFDVTATLPPRDVLAEWLFDSPNVEHYEETDGTRFSMRTCLVDMSEHGLILCLSAGSALKLTADHQQPHVTLIQRVLRSAGIDMAGVFVKRFDRLSRSTSMHVIHELRDLERRVGSSWSGDGELGRWDLGEMAEVFATIKGIGGRAEGLALRRKAVAGIKRETGRQMVDGKVRYSWAGGCPPGLFRYRDRASGRSVLAIDSPQYYPPPHDSLTGVPDVRDREGNLVDQAATLQWVLANLGLGGRGKHDLFPELLSRRWSTDGLRRERGQGPTAYWGGPTRPVNVHWPRRWLNVIVENLDLYETGRVVRKIGPNKDEIVIEGIFPASGAWATPQDFDRIRAFLASERPRGYQYWSWSEMPATLDDVPVRLVPAGTPTADGGVQWHLSFRPPQRRYASGGSIPVAEAVEAVAAERKKRHVNGARLVPDRELMAALVEGLLAADGLPMRPFVDEVNLRDDLESVRRLRDQLDAELVATTKSHEAQLALIMAVNEAGEPLMPEALRHRAYDDWTSQQESIDRMTRDRSRLERELAASSNAANGVPAPVMQALVNGLRNPRSNEIRGVLRDAVRNLAFSTERVVESGRVGTRVTISGDLVFSTSYGPHAVSFSREVLLGPLARHRERRLLALASLRAGTIPADGHPAWRGLRPIEPLKAFAGGPPAGPAGLIATGPSAIVACTDPALLRLGMAVLFPTPAPDENPTAVPGVDEVLADPQFGQDFGDVAALVQRIENFYTSTNIKGWFNKSLGGSHLTRLLIAEAAGQRHEVATGDLGWMMRAVDSLRVRGLFASGAWSYEGPGYRPRPAPCRHCGSSARAAMGIALPTGYVCLEPECRLDDAGVRWPIRFDCYIAYLSMWHQAGFSIGLEGPPGEDERPRDALGRHRRLTSAALLGPEQRAQLIAAYRDQSRTVREILIEHGVTYAAWCAVLREENVPRRRRRWT